MGNKIRAARVSSLISASRLRQIISYEPETGAFTWTSNGRGRFKRAGAEAGRIGAHGYVTVYVDGVRYQAHRLAWLYVHGSWPSGEIDHLNANRADNRMANLRDVSRRVNSENMRSARVDNGSGLLGAYWNKARGKWVSAITINGKQKYLGHFSSAHAAHESYVAAKRVHHTGCTL